MTNPATPPFRATRCFSTCCLNRISAANGSTPPPATPEEFVAFVKKLGKVMLKPACDGKGHGISIYEYTTDEDAVALHDTLVGAAMIAEEVLVQHPQVDLLNPNCINTVRVATYTDRDDVHIVLATLRSARDDSMVDNFARRRHLHGGGSGDGRNLLRRHRRADARLSHPSPHGHETGRLPAPRTGTRRWTSSAAPRGRCTRCPAAATWAGTSPS